MKITTKKEQKEKGERYYFTGKSCKHGHISVRFVSNGNCKQCANETTRKIRKNNPERTRRQRIESLNKWRKKNKEKKKQMDKEYYQKNKEKIKARVSKWRKENQEKKNYLDKIWKINNQEKVRKNAREWARNNSHIVKQQTRKRYAQKKLAFPDWANIKYIKLWYKFANMEQERTGKNVHVDHIVPIVSKHVCGLHNEFNLQLLFATDNKKKNNKTWPGMWKY